MTDHPGLWLPKRHLRSHPRCLASVLSSAEKANIAAIGVVNRMLADGLPLTPKQASSLGQTSLRVGMRMVTSPSSKPQSPRPNGAL